MRKAIGVDHHYTAGPADRCLFCSHTAHWHADVAKAASTWSDRGTPYQPASTISNTETLLTALDALTSGKIRDPVTWRRQADAAARRLGLVSLVQQWDDVQQAKNGQAQAPRLCQSPPCPRLPLATRRATARLVVPSHCLVLPCRRPAPTQPLPASAQARPSPPRRAQPGR